MPVSFVQQVSNSSATTVASLSMSITTTAGNLLVIYVSGPHVDNGSNTSFTGISPTIGIGYGGNTSATLTAAPSAGATSATLTAGWLGPTQPYVITFSTGEQRVATVTNGSTSLNWANGGGGLTSSATTALNIQGDQGLTGYYVANVSGGAKSITVTDASSTLHGIYAAEYSGCATSSPLLAVTGGLINGPGVGTDTITTVVVPSSSTPGLVAAMTIPGNWDTALAAGDVTAGTGYTGRTTVWAGAGAGYPEDKFPSSGTSFGSTWSSGSNAQYDPFFSVAMMFAAAASGSSVTPATGAAALSGNAPSMNLGISPRTARQAWERTKSGLLTPARKIFLPPRPRLALAF